MFRFFVFFGFGILWLGSLNKSESVNPSLESLGQKVFFDAHLSEPGGLSCASCHDPSLAFAGMPDGRFGVAHGSFPDRLGDRAVPTAMYQKNAPPFSWHVEDGTRLPNGGLFWDGRVDTLTQQARMPFFNPVEMNIANASTLVGKVQHSAYAEDFKRLFGPNVFEDSDLALERICQAIAAFEKSSLFQPFSSKYDHFLKGDIQLDNAESRGLDLFLDPQKGNCNACHPTDPCNPDPSASLFTDFSYDNLGIPRNRNLSQNQDPDHFDLGLGMHLSCEPERDQWMGAFKTPTLRNVARKNAFMHNGYFKDLRTVLAFYARRDTHPEAWYPKGQVFDDLPPAFRANVNRSEVPMDLSPGDEPHLSEQDIDDLLAFLKTLNDGYASP
ncbi:MAG: hypothetical protein KDC71_02445 [Acidobacteria bacterium]|nr:hypothetical protein [Acidobacteriota bacterium]